MPCILSEYNKGAVGLKKITSIEVLTRKMLSLPATLYFPLFQT